MFGLSKKGMALGLAGTAMAGAMLLNNSGPTQDDARKNLAKTVIGAYQNIDAKVAQIKDSRSGGGQEFNRNDGNAFGSTSTYHSYTWDYCMKWVGSETCGKWLDPYISEHGSGPDQSPLEGVVARAWEKRKDSLKGQGGKYAIWDVETRPGQVVTDEQGKLNRKALTRWEISADVQQEINKVADDTVLRAIASTYDEKDNEGANVMPNMESLRALAQSYTQMYRNNLVAKIGEARRNRAGIDMPGGEDYSDCSSVIAESEKVAEVLNTDQRLYNQDQIDVQSRSKSIADRAALCRAVMGTSAYVVNPTVRGNALVRGNRNLEPIEETRYRLNLAAIDSARTDVNKMAKPSDVVIQKDEYSSLTTELDADGRNPSLYYITPAEQLEQYNAELKRAARGMEQASKISGFIGNSSKQIEANQIGDIDLVNINGPTREMRNELKGQGVATIDNPDSIPKELTPAELVITAVK